MTPYNGTNKGLQDLELFIKNTLLWKKFTVGDNERLLRKRREYWGDDLEGVILLYNRRTVKYDDLDKIAKQCGYECFIQVGEAIWNTLTYYSAKEAFIIWLVKIKKRRTKYGMDK